MSLFSLLVILKTTSPIYIPTISDTGADLNIYQIIYNQIIERSMSPFNAPLILFKKKEEFLNKFHPLPIITDILDQLGQCQLFS